MTSKPGIHPVRAVHGLLVPPGDTSISRLTSDLTASGGAGVTALIPTRDHTERAFPAFGSDPLRDGADGTERGGLRPTAAAATLRVPSKRSSAAEWTVGLRAGERADGFVLDGSRKPIGALAEAAADHRPFMAFARAGLAGRIV